MNELFDQFDNFVEKAKELGVEFPQITAEVEGAPYPGDWTPEQIEAYKRRVESVFCTSENITTS